MISLGVLAGACGLHTAAMMAIEGMAFGQALWLSVTTATTVGYGDVSAATALGQLATGVIMYGAGITALAQSATYFFDYRQNKKERILNGDWNWNMEKHIVVLNGPKNDKGHFYKGLVSELRQSQQASAQAPIMLVTESFDQGIPNELLEMNTAHVNSRVSSDEAFERSDLKEAQTIVILAEDENDPTSDSVTFDLVSRARDENPNAVIIAEAVSKEYKTRLERAGANQVVRPMRNCPEHLSGSIISPGIEKVLDDIYDRDGEEATRYDVSIRGKWSDVAAKCYIEDIGAPLAYIDKNGNTIPACSDPGKDVDIQSLFVVVRSDNFKDTKEVARLLSKAKPNPKVETPKAQKPKKSLRKRLGL